MMFKVKLTKSNVNDRGYNWYYAPNWEPSKIYWCIAVVGEFFICVDDTTGLPFQFPLSYCKVLLTDLHEALE